MHIFKNMKVRLTLSSYTIHFKLIHSFESSTILLHIILTFKSHLDFSFNFILLEVHNVKETFMIENIFNDKFKPKQCLSKSLASNYTLIRN